MTERTPGRGPNGQLIITIASRQRPEVPQLERHLRGLRAEYGLSPQAMAGRFGVSDGHYRRNFESGREHPTISSRQLDRYVDVIGEIAPEGDPIAEGAVAHLYAATLPPERKERIADLLPEFPGTVIFSNVREVHEKEEDENVNWQSTFARVPIDQSLRLMRIEKDISRQEMADMIGFDVRTVTSSEHGKCRPSLSYLNAMLEAAYFPTDSFAAQTLRLRGMGIEIETTEEFLAASSESKIRYARVACGYTQERMAEVCGVLTSRIRDLELRTPKRVDVEAVLQPFVKDNPIAALPIQVLQVQRTNGDVTPQMVEALQKGKLMIYPSEDAKQELLHTSAEDKNVIKVLSKRTIGKGLRYLRTKRGLTIEQVGKLGGFDKTWYAHIERDARNMDRSGIYILNAFGYDIHSPVTHYILARAFDLRKEMRKPITKALPL